MVSAIEPLENIFLVHNIEIIIPLNNVTKNMASPMLKLSAKECANNTLQP